MWVGASSPALQAEKEEGAQKRRRPHGAAFSVDNYLLEFFFFYPKFRISG
jgi:hypothetical protein